MFRKKLLSFLSGCYSAWDLGYVGAPVHRHVRWTVLYDALRRDWDTVGESLHNAMRLVRAERPDLCLPETDDPDAAQMKLPLEQRAKPAEHHQPKVANSRR